MKRRGFVALAGTGISAALAGCFDSQATNSGENRITMTQVRFRPEEFTIPVGTTVIWDNTSSHSHTVTASSIPDEAEYFASGGFESYDAAEEAWRTDSGGKLEPGDSFEHEFTVTGRYDYVCLPHLRADMVGAIIVEPEEESGTTDTFLD